MAQKLKDLEITNVDFVDEGANKGADILITKQRDKKSGIRKAFHTLAVALGVADETDGEAVEKSAKSFEEMTTMASMDQINDEMWQVTRAIRESLWSILTDTEIGDDDRIGLMEQSIDQFSAAAKAASAKWSQGQLSNIKKQKDGGKEETGVQKSTQEGELEDMIKIDKSKMSDEERAQYEALVAKYKVDDESGKTEEGIEKKAKIQPKVDPEDNEEEVEDEKPEGNSKCKTTKSKDEPDDLYKGLNPAVKAELESLKKFKDDMETRQLTEVAKKYEILGKKPEELVPTLKSLKAAGGTAYNDMIAMLDSTVEMTKQSGMFDEVGKSNHGSAPAHVAKSAAEGKIETIAKGFMEKDPNLGYTQAVAKAWAENPDIYDEYESESHQ